MKAIITDIQGFSIHDGPGIRTVVFFKGCSLACQWCANPECISPQIQIGFFDNFCTNCGQCFTVCPNYALNNKGDGHRIDYSRCEACGNCVEACYYKALVKYGKEMSIDEVFEAVSRDKMFYDSSGGGITASGGEPLLNDSFVRTLFNLCKDAGINTCIETSGFVDSKKILNVLPETDYVLYDLKHIQSDVHLQYTGQPNELILKNAQLAVENSENVIFRVPLVPTINNDLDNIKNTAEFLKSITKEPKVEIMPYHRLGNSKYKALGMANLLEHLQPMEMESAEEIKDLFNRWGVECSISK